MNSNQPGSQQAPLMDLTEKWRDEADGAEARGYSQQADRMRDCADELEARLRAVHAGSQTNEEQNEDTRVDVQSQVRSVGSTAKIATGDVPTLDADVILELATKLEASFDPGGNLPDDCEEWAERHMDLIGELRGLAECALMGDDDGD